MDMTKVAPGQPGSMPEVGCCQPPTACITLILRRAFAMSSMGRHASAGRPLRRSKNSRRSSHTESYALLRSKEGLVKDRGLLQLCGQ